MKNFLLKTSYLQKNITNSSYIRYCIYFSIGYIFSLFTTVYADISIVSPTNILPGNPSTDITMGDTPDAGTAGDFIANIISYAIGLVAVLTILAVTWAGVQMVLAIGEEEKMKKARHTMIYAFIGLGLSGLSYGIVTFVTSLKLDSFL